ncbi:hypothetical protein Dace_2638 [Desulfuromonas acetoxidans DSM 684]|uniref:Uncharacterized protein n=1 Tax=Desulfuromonas acetoxidans (strain DSM 684 / 11070) TaxID=281689 RepID=Q1K296_DESA6|nr:hypothetical protein Dace_2638 [Desulfuromonas acetoxidans DSM 684]
MRGKFKTSIIINIFLYLFVCYAGVNFLVRENIYLASQYGIKIYIIISIILFTLILIVGLFVNPFAFRRIALIWNCFLFFLLFILKIVSWIIIFFVLDVKPTEIIFNLENILQLLVGLAFLGCVCSLLKLKIGKA